MVLEFVSRAVQHDWLMRLANPAFGRWNPFLASFRRDPYPAYRRLRERAPVYRHRLLQCHVYSRHEDVTALLAHPDMSVARGESDLFKKYAPFDKASPLLRSALFRSLLMLDPPDHTRIRGLVNKAFTPRAAERIADRVRELTEERLAEVRPGEPFDFLGRFAVPLPLIVICELLGVPTDRLPDLKRWSELLTQLLDPISMVGALANSQSAIHELAEYFDGLFRERREAPGDDLLTRLLEAEEDGDRLDDAELISLVALLLAAGHETTTNLIANSVLALERRPELRARIASDPEVAPRAVEELLRYDSPIQVTDRLVGRDIEYGGVALRRGEMVVLLLGAANRDPEVWPEPDAIDFDRPAARHLSFGHGAHFCVGAALARLEGRIALPAVFRALGDYRIDREGLDWKRSIVLRGPTALRVVPGSGGKARAAG